MKLSRREFGKLLAFATAAAALPMTLLTGCSGSDAVIAALNVAGAVAKSAAGILFNVAPNLSQLLTKVSADLAQVVSLYKQYDSAAGDKPTTFGLIQATLSTITNNLADILGALHIFNPGLQVIIKTAVAIVNSAISFIISHLPQPHQAQARLARLNMKPLPSIDGAKSAADLKKVWNDAVKGDYPQAVVK